MNINLINKDCTYLDLLPRDVSNIIYTYKSKLDYEDVLKSIRTELTPQKTSQSNSELNAESNAQSINMYEKLKNKILDYYDINYYDIEFIPDTVSLFIDFIQENISKEEIYNLNNIYNNIYWKFGEPNAIDRIYFVNNHNVMSLEKFLNNLDYQELLSFNKFIN